MLYTILQIIAFQALFLLVYDLFLKRETFFNYNRAYLLFTSVLSLILPFLKFPELKQLAAKEFVIQLPEVFIGTKTPTASEIQIAEFAGIIIEQPETPIWQSIVFIGIIIATVLFLFKMTKLYWLKHQNPKRWQGNVLIVSLIKSSAAFSFFNTIFLGERISETEKSTIYRHELVHINELHTLDLLFFEMLRIVFWFNPLIYIYQNRIKELHEYIADAKAIKQNGKSDYYQNLLNQVFDVNNVSFTNSFFKKSLIKKRIAMLQKSKSKQFNLIKYALLIPMVFGMLIYTSTEVRAQQKVVVQEVVDQELTDEELIKKYMEEFAQMNKEGTGFMEIMESLNLTRNYKYIKSRTEYLKFVAFGRYLRQQSIEKKSENGSLTQQDIDTSEEMQSRTKTYAEYLEWKQTDEAKEEWELSTQGGILKLFVNEVGNMTESEQNRFDGLMKQLETDSYFRKLVVTDGKSTMSIDSPNNPEYQVLEIEEVSDTVEVPFSVVEVTPTTSQCADFETNEERKHCFSQFVNKHINKSFNTDLAKSLGLSSGPKRIFVSFKIDKQGNVKDIRARGPHPKLEEEAVRVINMLPQFVPGKQKGMLVTVPFSIPIVVQVQGDSKVLESDSTMINSEVNRIKKYLQRDLHKTNTELEGAPFSKVEIAPINVGCTTLTTEVEKRKCTVDAISSFVNRNFNTKLVNSIGLSSGQKRIYVRFIIDKQGNIINIVARGPHPKLEEEAIRVVKMLPHFIPGKQDGELIDVPFSLPIVVKVVN